MIVTELRLANVRAIRTLELRFRPGLNLLVGTNGMGKTSVLDALGVCLSATVKRANSLKGRPEAFSVADIRFGRGALDVNCGIRIGERNYTYSLHKPRDTVAPQDRMAGLPRAQVYDTPDKGTFLGRPLPPATAGEKGGRPLAVLFSTRRAVPVERAPSKRAAAGGIAAAFADAFAKRELRLGEFGAWLRAREALEAESPSGRGAVGTLQEAIARFLPGYEHLRVAGDGRRRLVIDRGSATLSVSQLSDGERGLLALVLELTRRLLQANPELSDPTAEAEAVVLIDEIDLHLHPEWQRQVVSKLTATFPRCQFVATTHSPQVVASVEPDRISLLSPDGLKRPHRSLGTDSNWILRHLMEADDRPEDAATSIRNVEALIREGEFDAAHAAIAEAKRGGLDLPDWSMLEARIARLEILAE